jgi:stage II sporulation protein D
MFHNRILFGLFFLLAGTVRSTTIDVHLLSDIKPLSVIVSVSSGSYIAWGDGKRISDTLSSFILEFNLSGDSIITKTLEKKLGTFKHISLNAQVPASSFKLKSISPAVGLRIYDNDLLVSADRDQLILLNRVDLEKYVAGVVEAESGTIAEDEFYKVQSILCRTYVLANINKHAGDGFNVCDQVHCQVFRGKTKDPRIFFATNATKDLVVVDNDLKLISTTFCSNCGGQTVNSEDVWGKSTMCLKSVKDTFCSHMPHAVWERRISVEDWKNYLELKHKFPVNDSVTFSNALNCSPSGRQIYFSDHNLKIPLKIIRTDFQLKSTFFSVVQRNDSVIFKGRGYGHGVGLCQEGAMEMAKRGYSFTDILNFYYRNINVVDLGRLDFFKEGEE